MTTAAAGPPTGAVDCEAQLQERLRQLDPLHHGAPSVWAVRLLRRLLAWNPHDRPTAETALRHAYFHGAYRCHVCGEEFEYPDDLEVHLSSTGHRHARSPAGADHEADPDVAPLDDEL